MEVHIARARAETRLHASQTRLQTIVDNAPAGIALLDHTWRVRECNRRWTDLLGLDPRAALEMSLLTLVHPDDRAQRGERLQALADGVTDRYQRKTRMPRSDGDFFWVDLVVAPVLSAGDRPNGFVAMFSEVSAAPELNPRQREVLLLMAQGLTYKAISAQLLISERTVRYHVDELLKRLNVRSRAEAIAYIAREGLAGEQA